MPSAGLCCTAVIVISASTHEGTCGLGIIWSNFREGWWKGDAHVSQDPELAPGL
jgi:hypothetical protein